MGFPRQEYCSGLPFPSPGHLPNPGIKSGSLASVAMASRFFFTSTTWETPAHSWVWPSDHLCFSFSTLIYHIPFLFRDSNYMYVRLLEVFLGGSTDKEPTCQCRRCKRCSFNPWVGKIPWRSGNAPVFVPGKLHGERSLLRLMGHKESDMMDSMH